MIDIIITAYGELDSTIKTIDSFLNQNIRKPYRITVTDPFPKIEKILKKKYGKKLDFFLDPGEGKSYALNLFMEKIYSSNKSDIIILTDGDVYVSENTISEVLNAFKDESVGCITARPVALDSRKKKFGYWSHLVFDGIHNARKKLDNKGKFFECSGYLFAIRNGILKGFPLNTSEDSIIPFLFWKQGYKIKYLPNVEVYILNNYNWKTWKKQKIRNIKGHENLNKIAPDMPRTKSFFNEIKHGWHYLFFFPKNTREFYWTIQLYFARLYIYFKSFYDIKLKKKKYEDAFRAEYY